MKGNHLDAIYEHYVQDVYRYLYSLSYDHHTAEDLVQETFYRAYLYLENCREDKIKPWLFRVAYNAYIDAQRKASRSTLQEPDYFQRNLTDTHTPEDEVLRQERWDEIGRALSGLPENQRQAMLLIDFNQLTYQEAADIMDIRLSHVKILLFRARQALRDQGRKGDQNE